MKIKILLPIILLFFSCKNLIAQKNQFGFNINYLSINNSSPELSTAQGIDIYSRSNQITPVLTYLREIKSGVLCGLELGLNRFKEKGNNGYIDKYNGQLYFKNYTAHAHGFYFAPTIFEEFKKEKLVIRLGLALPIDYYGVMSVNICETSRFNNGNENVSYTDIIYPKRISLGFTGNIGISIKLIKQLYVGAQLGIGILYSRRIGKQFSMVTSYFNGVLENEEIEIIQFKKDNTFDLYSRPTIGFFYRF